MGTMKVSEVIALLERHGWYLIKSRGGHRQFKLAELAGRVTVPGKLSDNLAPGTQQSILKQAGLRGRK